MKKKKGFTLVELLVVIAIIALLMGILMPALARVRQIAFRMVCGTNLSGIGKAMLIYSNDYEDELPRAAGMGSTWAANITDWAATNRFNAYNLDPTTGGGGVASISASFYLLVKYAEVTPKSFLCKGDSGAGEFKPADYGAGNRELIDLWDFGTTPLNHCSYSYHLPYPAVAGGQSFALTTSSEPGMAVAADRNPFQADATGTVAKEFVGFNPLGTRVQIKEGNAGQHQDEGQNVLFLDSHVSFEKRAFCAISDDNIYTYQNAGDPRLGAPPNFGQGPAIRGDSYLVTDGAGSGGGGGTTGGTTPPPKTRTCFVAETELWLDGSLVSISDAQDGQKVGRVNCVSMTAQLDTIETVQEHQGSFECRDIALDSGNTVSVVDSHCFMLDSGKWVAAQDLEAGMTLKTTGGSVNIKSVVLRAEKFTGKVYNLKMQGTDRYPVGKDGVIVRDF